MFRPVYPYTVVVVSVSLLLLLLLLLLSLSLLFFFPFFFLFSFLFQFMVIQVYSQLITKHGCVWQNFNRCVCCFANVLTKPLFPLNCFVCMFQFIFCVWILWFTNLGRVCSHCLNIEILNKFQHPGIFCMVSTEQTPCFTAHCNVGLLACSLQMYSTGKFPRGNRKYAWIKKKKKKRERRERKKCSGANWQNIVDFFFLLRNVVHLKVVELFPCDSGKCHIFGVPSSIVANFVVLVSGS